DTRLELLFLQQALSIGVDEPADAPTHLLDQLADLLAGTAPFLFLPAAPALVLAAQPLRVRQQGAGILPHGLVQQVRAALPVAADPLAAEPVGIRADAAVVGVVARLAFPRRSAERLAVVGVATAPAHQQPLQQVADAPPAGTAAPPILLELFGHGREHFLADQGGDLDGDAVGLGGVVGGDGPARLRLFPSQRSQTRPTRADPRLAELRPAPVGRV